VKYGYAAPLFATPVYVKDLNEGEQFQTHRSEAKKTAALELDLVRYDSLKGSFSNKGR